MINRRTHIIKSVDKGYRKTKLDNLEQSLDSTIDNRNYFQVLKVTGTFDKMNVRSELAQEEPYKPLAKVMETDQRFFDYKDIPGTVVGVYCPVYMDQLNSAQSEDVKKVEKPKD